MKRVIGILLAILVVGLASFFFAPVVPTRHSYSSETICPSSTQLCSIGDNSLNSRGYGSISYALFGVGGWWESSSGFQVFSSTSSSRVFTYTQTTGAGSQEGSTTTNTLGSVISVSGVSLCASNCIYPSPYATALVQFNSNSPVSTLKVYVNGTYDATPLQNPSNNMTHYAYLWKGSVPNSLTPVVKGDVYVFEFTVVYQDGSTGSAYAQTVAS